MVVPLIAASAAPVAPAREAVAASPIGGAGSAPLVELPDFPPLPIYERVTEAAGLGAFLHAGYLGPGNIFDPPALFTEFTGPGACWFDYDGDDWLDLYLVNTRYQTDPGKNVALDPHSLLFRNNGDGTFTDVTLAANARAEGILQGCAAADYTGNGYPDLYVTGWGGGVLLRNNGDGTFTDETLAAGVRNLDCGVFVCWGTSAVWFDANRDGCLDLFITNYTEFDADNPPPFPGPGPGQLNRYFESNCDGTFLDRSDASGLRAVKSDSFSAVAADLNNNGWPDLYISNDGDENDVFLNNGDGTFTRDATSEANDPGAGMGTAVADFDRDGRHDLVTTNFVSQVNGVFQSFGSGYVNIGGNAPFSDSDPYSGWATHFFDMDNDGLLDLMVFNGLTQHALLDPEQPILSYRNLDASGAFESVRGLIGPDVEGQWTARGGAWADYDNNGAVDFLLAEAGEAPTHLFRAYGVGNQFLSVDLRSGVPGVNPDAIGARVTVSAPGLGTQMQEKVAGTGFMSSSDPRLHFGLAAATAADIQIRWPDGTLENHLNVRANSFVRATQGDGLLVLRELPLLTLTGPVEAVKRLEDVAFHVDAVPAAGRTIVAYEWHFGGDPVPGGAMATHAFDDVGLFTVRVTVTDSAGDRRSAWTQVVVWDDLTAVIEMPDTFWIDEHPAGTVRVTFSDGAPVADAQVDLIVRRTTGVAALDELMANMPFFLQELAGWVPVELDGRTGPDGTYTFVVPGNVPQPSPLVPEPTEHYPGHYVTTAAGGARGSVFDPAEVTYGVVVPPI